MEVLKRLMPSEESARVSHWNSIAQTSKGVYFRYDLTNIEVQNVLRVVS